jgi:hypothetical protein
LGLLPPGFKSAEVADTLIVSENYFSVLGVAPLRGTTFESIGARELAASPAVLISETTGSGGSPAILRCSAK